MMIKSSVNASTNFLPIVDMADSRLLLYPKPPSSISFSATRLPMLEHFPLAPSLGDK